MADSVPIHAAGGDMAAVVAYKYQDDPRNMFDASIVIQVSSSGITSQTQFDGKIYSLSYSPDGKRLLAYQSLAADLPARGIRAHLMNNEGRVLWSMTEPEVQLSFSNTGAVLYDWYRYPYVLEPGARTVKLFDLDGNALGTVATDKSDVYGVVVPDDGEEVIFVLSLDRRGRPGLRGE